MNSNPSEIDILPIAGKLDDICPAISAPYFWEKFWHILETQGRGREMYQVSIVREGGKVLGDTYLIDALRMTEYFEDPMIRYITIESDSTDPDDFSLSFTRNFTKDHSRWGIVGKGINRILPGLLINEMVGETIFSVASLKNSTYLGWQVCSRPDSYLRQYGSIEGFRTISDLPPPLDHIKQLDTSLNPGGVRHIAGQSFRMAADMWLGPRFWQYAKCTKDEVLAENFFIEKLDTPHFLYLKSWPEPFTRPDGEQGRIQQRLWKLFFHEDCEWPPGSGVICDEPIDGPPELFGVSAE